MGKSFFFVVILSVFQVSVAFADKMLNTDGMGNELNSYGIVDESQPATSGRKPPTAEQLETMADCNLNHGGSYDMDRHICVVDRAPEAAGTNKQNGASANASSIGQACIDDTEEATKQCNFAGNKEAQMAVGMANNMRQQVKAMSMTSPALMCSKLGNVSQAIDAAVGAFSAYCSTAYSACESSCTADYEELKAKLESAPAAGKVAFEERLEQIKTKRKECGKLAGNVKNVFENVGSYAAIEQAKSQYCGEQTNALAELCKSQPGNVLCKTGGAGANCADPNVAASSVVCICQANRNDPRCGAQNAVGLQSGLNGSRSNGAGADGGKDALADFGGLDGAGGGVGFDASSLKGDSGDDGPGRPRSGVSGGRASLDGGSGGSGKGGAGAGAGGSGLNAKIIAGYGAGGAGAAGRNYGTAGAAGYGAAATGRNGYGNGAAGGKPGVDLRKFLPGGQMDPSRGLAGAAGPDGITGPNSDIWKKIQMRYFSVSPSLLP